MRRRLSAAREPFSFLTASEPLHVDDPARANREDHEPLLVAPFTDRPLGRPDYLVADLSEARHNRLGRLAALMQQIPQDLTGLVRTVSTGSALPPKMPAGRAAPLVFLVD